MLPTFTKSNGVSVLMQYFRAGHYPGYIQQIAVLTICIKQFALSDLNCERAWRRVRKTTYFLNSVMY